MALNEGAQRVAREADVPVPVPVPVPLHVPVNVPVPGNVHVHGSRVTRTGTGTGTGTNAAGIGLTRRAVLRGAAGAARAGGAYLTCAHPRKTGGANIQVGTSVDQIAAKVLGEGTPFRSVELGTEASAQAGSCDSGYSCAYSSNLSWSSPSTPLAK